MNKAGVSFMIFNMFVVFMKEDVAMKLILIYGGHFCCFCHEMPMITRPFSSNIYGEEYVVRHPFL